MSFLLWRSRLLVLTACSAAAIGFAVYGCSSTSGGGTADAGMAAVETGSDGEAVVPDAAALDASCPKAKALPDKGETCVGFGKGSPCDPACGLGEYGYVCFNGGPPGFMGCLQASSTGSFGDTYCCPKNDCVPQPDQDGKCTAAGKTHRYQCPPDGNGGSVAPPAGCGDGGGGGTALEKFYCCP